jgi:CHAD domain-containing protein
MAVAARKPSTENLHEWRKQAKYLWHDLQVLEPVWPGVMKELAEQAHDLTQLLGDDHDLAVLHETVATNREKAGTEDVIEALFALIDRRRAELQREAFMLGKRLYLAKPGAFTDQIKGYWKVWRLENKSAGEA